MEIEDRFIQTTEDAELCKEMEKLRRLNPSQELRRRGQARRCLLYSNVSDADSVSDPMDFDNEFLDALAHLDIAPAAHSDIKTFKSVTPSARSPPPAGVPDSIESDSDGVYTDVYDASSDEVVSDEDGNPAYTSRSRREPVDV